MKVLVVEDDAQTASFLGRGLQEAGYGVDVAADGVAGLEMASRGGYGALVVDRMLPRMDGLLLVETLRRMQCRVPVLFLSALGDVDERIKGLQSGGDDYVCKPFAIAEVLARVEVLLRRGETSSPAASLLSVGGLEMNLLSRTVRRNGSIIALQPREYRLLEYLLRHAGQVVTRAMLLQAVWDYHFDPQTNVIDVHISRLRQKIDRDAEHPLIHTVRGAGYMLRDGI
ncbi:MAG TPA: response regulator transcription factor [Candidatus Sulfotelmatobacter sp.]|jgi:two-component system OmpR family response regulator|nr:response regulator transcription factor [Candidatus Sulfotelmatobacter sp.]